MKQQQLNKNLLQRQLMRFSLNSNNKVEFNPNYKLDIQNLKENLVNKFVISILKDKPKWCDKYSQNDIPSKIKLKLNERRFTEVQSLIDDYYSLREKQREGIIWTPIKLTFYEEIINCRIGTKRMDEAYSWTNECFELRLSLFGWENVESANGCNSVGYVLFYLRKIKESQFYVEQAIFWSVTYKGTDNAELATAYNNIAYLVMNNNEVENSLRYHYKALKIRKQLHPKGHNDLGSTYNNIGQNLTRLKKNNDSLIYYQKAMNVWIRLMGYKHNTVSLALSNIANTYTAMGKYDHSIIFHRISYLVRYQTLKQDSIDSGQLSNDKSFVQINNHDLAITLDNIGFTYTKQEKFDEAINIQELGKKMWKELNLRNKTHLQSFVVSLNNLCNTHKKQGNYDKAFIEVYETKKILDDSSDQNLIKSQTGYIRQIKSEINRYAITTLRQVNQYLQVNQNDSAIALLFKVAFLYDQILRKIQQVDNLTKEEFTKPIKLPAIGEIKDGLEEEYSKIFPYIVQYKNMTVFVKLPPRCFPSDKIDSKEIEISGILKKKHDEYVKDTTKNETNSETLNQAKHKNPINETIQNHNLELKKEFDNIFKRFGYVNIQQLIMILLIQSIGDILFDKIIRKLQDNDFFRQSKEILTELKYILDAHITSKKTEINAQFSWYKKIYASKR